MLFSTVNLVPLILLASQAVALVPSSPFVQLFARQTTIACTSSCSIVNDALEACALEKQTQTPQACFCTATVANGLSTCVNCYYSNTPTSAELATVNQLISTFKYICGPYNLPAITVNTSSSASTASATSSGSGSLTTSVANNGAPSSPRASYILSLVFLVIGTFITEIL